MKNNPKHVQNPIRQREQALTNKKMELRACKKIISQMKRELRAAQEDNRLLHQCCEDLEEVIKERKDELATLKSSGEGKI